MFAPSALDLYPQNRGVYERLKAVLAKATRDNLNSPDWATNLQFCDLVKANLSAHSCEFAVLAIIKRISTLPGHSNRVNWLTLMLLETCMKNGGLSFHRAVADETKLLKLMLKLVKGRIAGKNRSTGNAKDLMRDLMEERILLLIRAWGKAFKHSEAPLNAFTDCYRKLRKQGVVFPEERPEDAIGPDLAAEKKRESKPELQKRQKPGASLEDLASSLNLLTDMLDGVPADERPDKDELIVELVKTCAGQKPRLVELIQANVDKERVVAPLMKLFERLEMILGEYELRCKEPGTVPIRKYSNFFDDSAEEVESQSAESDEEEEVEETDQSNDDDARFIGNRADGHTTNSPAFTSNPFLLPSPMPVVSAAPFNTPYPTSPAWPSSSAAQPQLGGFVASPPPVGTYFNPFAPQYQVPPIQPPAAKDNNLTDLQLDFLASVRKPTNQPARTDPFLDWLVSPKAN